MQGSGLVVSGFGEGFPDSGMTPKPYQNSQHHPAHQIPERCKHPDLKYRQFFKVLGVRQKNRAWGLE